LELNGVRILRYPHPTLRHKSRPLRRVDGELRKMVRQMFDVMYEGRGIGLAANQVDLPYRLFILNLKSDPNEPEAEQVFINPVITERKGTVEDEEGCLSFPSMYANVRRSEKIMLSAYDLQGAEVTYQMTGLAARAAQHESDHLDGVLFVDRLSPTGLLAVRDAIDEFERNFLTEREMGLVPDNMSISSRLKELEMMRT
jgi:peptide deformylase